jgi:DNA-binding NtrC family response regulator
MVSTQQKTILIIETHQALQMLYDAELQEAGFKTLLAPSAAEVQKLLDNNRVDLIMSDLPGSRGAGMSSLSLLAGARNIPLLINTGYPLGMIDREAISAAACIQQKSSDIDKLKSKIGELLENEAGAIQAYQGDKVQKAIEKMANSPVSRAVPHVPRNSSTRPESRTLPNGIRHGAL